MGRGRANASNRVPRTGSVPQRIHIPDLTGMIVAAALRQADHVGFSLVIADPPMAIEQLASSGRWVVAEQDPSAQASRFRGDTVVVILRHQGGGNPAGDREPRNPVPRRRVGREIRPDDVPAEHPLRLIGRSERQGELDSSGVLGVDRSEPAGN